VWKSILGDAVLVLLLGGIAVAVLWGTAGIPPSRWEPLGAASLPRALAWGLLILAGIVAAGVIAKAFLPGYSAAQAIDAPIPVHRYAATAAFLLVTVAAIWAMSVGWLGYRPAALGLIVVSVLVLSGFSQRVILPSLVLAAVLSFGVHFVLTTFLAIRLP
jgi:putative tricarboxylic transport membrane protein